MIEPYTTEKQCTACGECKPLTDFSPSKRGRLGRQPYCKPCRSEMIAKRQRGDRKKKGSQGDTNPTAWILPHFPMMESLRCVQLRKWRGPVSNEPMRARL